MTECKLPVGDVADFLFALADLIRHVNEKGGAGVTFGEPIIVGTSRNADAAKHAASDDVAYKFPPRWPPRGSTGDVADLVQAAADLVREVSKRGAVRVVFSDTITVFRSSAGDDVAYKFPFPPWPRP